MIAYFAFVFETSLCRLKGAEDASSHIDTIAQGIHNFFRCRNVFLYLYGIELKFFNRLKGIWKADWRRGDRQTRSPIKCSHQQK